MRTKIYRKNKKYRKSKRFFIKKKNYKKRKYSKKQIGRGNSTNSRPTPRVRFAVTKPDDGSPIGMNIRGPKKDEPLTGVFLDKIADDSRAFAMGLRNGMRVASFDGADMMEATRADVGKRMKQAMDGPGTFNVELIPGPGPGPSTNSKNSSSINNKQLCSKVDKQIETITDGQSLYEYLVEIYKGVPYKQKNDEIKKKN